VGQGFPSSPDPLPLSYAVRYASRLSVSGKWRLLRNTKLTHSIRRNSVRERETNIEVFLHLHKQIVGVDHPGLLPFLCTWYQCSVSVGPCSVDCLSAATVMTY
jgi:hypothetical protein